MVQKIVQKWSKGLRVQSILYSMPFLCCVMLVSIESIPRPILKTSSFMWLWLALKSTQRKEDYNECHDMTELFINYLLNNLHNSTIMFSKVTSYIGFLELVAIPFSNFYVYGQMNELPEIGSFRLRTDFQDRRGANIVTRQKGTYGERLLDVQKEILARNYGFFRRSFIINGINMMLISGKCKFQLELPRNIS